MDIRQSIGEVSGSNIIDKGDNVRIIFFEKNKKETMEGIITNVNEKEIKVNGASPFRKIKIESISEISKIK